jgi:hypothetical protein
MKADGMDDHITTHAEYENYDMYKILFGKLEGKGPPGRPVRENNIKSGF